MINKSFNYEKAYERPNTKKFNNKKYFCVSRSGDTKLDAKTLAMLYKERGYNARIIKIKKKYFVYVRDKRDN